MQPPEEMMQGRKHPRTADSGTYILAPSTLACLVKSAKKTPSTKNVLSIPCQKQQQEIPSKLAWQPSLRHPARSDGLRTNSRVKLNSALPNHRWLNFSTAGLTRGLRDGVPNVFTSYVHDPGQVGCAARSQMQLGFPPGSPQVPTKEATRCCAIDLVRHEYAIRLGQCLRRNPDFLILTPKPTMCCAWQLPKIF